MRHENVQINWPVLASVLLVAVALWSLVYWRVRVETPPANRWITLQQHQRYAVCPEEFTCYVNNNGGPMIAFKTVVKHWDGTSWKDVYK